MIDDIHENSHLGGEVDFLTELGTVLNQSDVPFIIAGRRRFNETFVQSDLQRRQLSAPSFEDAGLLVSTLAAKFGVVTTDQTRDLLAVQFDGNPRLLSFMLASAADAGLTLNSFRDVEKLYADEVFGGRTARYFDSLLATAVPSASQRREFLGLIFDAQSESERVPVAAWRTRVDSRPEDFERAIAALNTAEFLRLTSDMIAPMDDDPVIGDYIEARFRLEVLQQNRALTVGEATADFLKRAPRMMATFYRRRSALGMREMLAAFNCQEVPLALLDYGRFRDELKGATAADVAAALAQDEDRVMLPQIVYTAHTVSFYPQFARVTERERSAVALGFSETSYTDQDETVWIGAEIDSKLEATRELTEFWCDRLEMVALMCNFQNYRLWLIAPEGFTSEALEVLQSRNAFGSSRRQFSLLAGEIGAGVGQRESVGGTSYEMIVPMGDDTELIAAQTVEEIARRHNFPAKSINQIKTALVEACINATEHSHSPDRRIYQTFTIEDDRLNITVTNRGVRLTDARSREVNPSEGRRGWGLRLMRKLMDDVRVERTDDGTRISMTKLIPAN
jgi:serine/threonine-protein kinase RsbW